jgi:hypothetical protein
MVLVYGWAMIGCVILLGVLVPMLWKARKASGLWRDSYFWLLAGVAVSALAVGEVMLARVIQTFALGKALHAQPAPLAMLATITAAVAIALKLRSVAITKPRTGLLAIIACLVWAALMLAV